MSRRPRTGWSSGSLLWLPDDETKALAAIDLLLAYGVSASARNRAGETAADVAERRGLLAAAARLRVVEGHASRVDRSRVDLYDGPAHDLLLAHDSGFEPAMQRLRRHDGLPFSWDELRAEVKDTLAVIPRHELPNPSMYAGYFALPEARLLVARQAGFESWEALVKAGGEVG